MNILKDNNFQDNYETMLLMLSGQIEGEENLITNLSNASAIIKAMVNDINWAGFYLFSKDELVLGPFQGMPACNRIEFGKGVCGIAVKEKRVIIVDNVHEFSGHIACDSATNSEIVVPIIINGEVKGVLDVDSASLGRFNHLEDHFFTKFVEILSNCNWK